MESFCLVSSSSDKPRRNILLTGFGPFKTLTNNVSWEGVKKMDLSRIETDYVMCVAKKEASVVYKAVDEDVPKWLRNHEPHLTIHVGVSSNVSCFVLETQAHKKGYKDEDDEGFRPLYFEVPRGYEQDVSPDTLVTQLDVAAICRQFNYRNRDNKMQAKISSDAGRYLCEYIYYTTLQLSPNPSLFIHVPVSKYNSIKIARGLECILELCLKQLPKDDHYSYTVE